MHSEMSTAGPIEKKKSSGKGTMMRLLKRSMSFSSSSRRGSGTSSDLLDTGDISALGATASFTSISSNKTSSGLAKKFKRGMQKAFSLNRTSTTGSMATQDLEDCSPSFGSTMSSSNPTALHEDASFSQKLKRGLKKAFSTNNGSTTEPFSGADMVESSATSATSVGSDLPAPVFNKVVRGSVDIKAGGEVRHTNTNPLTSSLTPSPRTPARHSSNKQQETQANACKDEPVTPAVSEDVSPEAFSNAFLGHTSDLSTPTQDPTTLDSLLLTIPEEKTGDLGFSSIGTPHSVGDDGKVLGFETPTADISGPEVAPACSLELLQAAVPSVSAIEVSPEPLFKQNSFASDASEGPLVLEGSRDSSGPGSPTITTGFSGPRSFAKLALTTMSKDKSKEDTPIVKMHLRQKPPSMVKLAVAGVALVVALTFGATMTRGARKGWRKNAELHHQ